MARARDKVTRAPALGTLLLAACSGTPLPPSSPAPSPPQPPRVSEAPPPSEELDRPCVPGSAEHRAAHAKLAAIDAAIAALPPDGAPDPILTELAELGASPCFALGGYLQIPAASPEAFAWGRRPDSGLALKSYWTEQLGRDFVLGYLDLAVRGEDAPFVIVEPDFRTTLARETAPGHPLAPLLCSLTDDACRTETAGFRHRAAQRLYWESAAAREESDPSGPLARCLAHLATLPPEDRFGGFVACQDEAAPRVLELPVVGIRRPTTGWLVVSGRRGHHHFCYERAAYELSTGAAYIVKSCSDLALQPEGQVDPRATDAGRARTAEQGTLTPAYVQELVWFLLLAPELERRVQAFGTRLPSGIEPVMLAGIGKAFSVAGFSGGCGNPSDTELTWRYVLEDRVVREGKLTYPGCSRQQVENDYAVELLDIAELSFTSGCAPATGAPRPSPPLRASRLDSDLKRLQRADADLARAWSELTAGAPCSPAPTPH